MRNVPEAAADVPLADVLLRRFDETQVALANGAVVVCFARPATAHRGIAGIQQPLDDYYWLPREGGLTYAPPQLVPADGTRVHVVDYEHPLAGFVASLSANVEYRARIDVGNTPGLTARDVFVRSEGGAAVGVEMPAASGRIIFPPALRDLPPGDERYAMSDALQAGIWRALGALAEGRPPPWLSRHPLPGLDERQVARDEAKRAVESAQASLLAVERAYDEIARYQRMLWQEGPLGLDDVVHDALRLIGFDVYANDPSAFELRAAGAAVFVEIEASEHQIDMAAHHRLRQRIERAIEQRGEAPRGLLIVNGCRLQEPPARPQQVTDAVRIAAETLRYCIATTAGLFHAVVAKLSGDEAAVAAYRERLITTDGIVAELAQPPADSAQPQAG